MASANCSRRKIPPEGIVTAEVSTDESGGRVFCYGAKEHPEYASGHGDMIITYVCNSTDFPTLISDMELYRPQVVRRQILFSR